MWDVLDNKEVAEIVTTELPCPGQRGGTDLPKHASARDGPWQSGQLERHCGGARAPFHCCCIGATKNMFIAARTRRIRFLEVSS